MVWDVGSVSRLLAWEQVTSRSGHGTKDPDGIGPNLVKIQLTSKTAMPGSCEKIDARTHLFVSCCSGVSNYILTYLQFNMRVPAVSVTLLNSSKRQPQDSTWNLKQVWIWKIMEKHIAVEGDCFCVSKS